MNSPVSKRAQGPARRAATILAAVACLALSAGEARADGGLSADQTEFFEKRIRPLFANHCQECHGPEKQRGGLRVDSREGLRKGGDSGPAVLPGKAAGSLLIRSVSHRDTDSPMPKDRPKLSEASIADLTRWVNEGAPDPRDLPAQPATGSGNWEQVLKTRKEWWSFKPVARHPVPAVANGAWPREATDRFILAKLEEKGIQPAPPAPPGAWFRRVHFAITGLPPSPEEVRSFLADSSETARAEVVDRLLASPHFGERWARHWMDLARYAETYGHEQDYPIPHAWRYRDYLVRAFNADVPYGQFAREHIAGDLLPNPRRDPGTGRNESVLATGFWGLHQATHAPVDPLQDEADRIDNQIDVFSKTFLGLTVACARCHDHKFDPISTRDYYSLTAFLRASRQDIAYLDPDGGLEKAVAELEQSHGRDTEVLRQAARSALAEGKPNAGAYLLAAREALIGPARPGDREAVIRTDIVFEDFEDGTYAKWKVEGEAFGTQPASGKHPNQQAVEGFAGKRLANSFTRGDAPKGALRSHPFRIERGHIRFLLGGGTPTKKARFVLRVEGREVREATGRNMERLEPGAWEVREFAGKEATLEIIDEDETIWGHINVDHIVFSDSPEANRLARPVRKVAEERKLKPELLQKWVDELTSPAARKPNHPLRAWAGFADREQTVPPAATAPSSNGTVAIPGPAEWFPSGQAFRSQTTAERNWRVAGAGIDFLPARAAHSGLLGDGLHGTLRSPTFTITQPNLHLSLSGSGGQVRLVISRYGLREYNPLLFERTLFDVNTEGVFAWSSITTDLVRHIGRPAYLEIIDNGDGFAGIEQALLSPNPDPPSFGQEEGTFPTGASEGERSRLFDASVRGALAKWLQGTADGEPLATLSWLSQKGLLDWGEAGRAIAGIAERGRAGSAKLPKPLRALALTDGTAEETRVFLRGETKAPGPTVSRRFLEVVAGPAPAAIAKGSGRIELAEAALSVGNPLAYRVIVNRVWAHLFGRGLAATVDNLGAMGRPPTHPELLDYLALRFREEGGSFKRLIRQLCLTSAYQMSSSPDDPAAEARDPENDLLHRMRLQRLEGEAIRDSLLAVSGQLNRTQFGPSVPTHFTPFMGDRMWVKSDSGPMDGDRRRSLYLETRRNFLSPMMLTFDLPLPDTTVGQRNSSNVPGQALTMMNDPFVRSQAEALGREMADRTDEPPRERIREMFLRALARLPRPAESERMLAFLKSQAESGGIDASRIADSRTLWADASHVLFMTKEFIHVP